ncbi:MAG TPA: toxin secretion, membrane fusion protein [Desulfobacterales bacterium]|nr:MAG: toxin secretion, membrane fusion protein [Deltaproteobacteria bacterium]HHC25636.1 toxin secretion, membrane fusion protein [Desulfobacterales bacterium]
MAKVCRKVSIKNQPSDFAYWQSRSYEERLACLEEIRQEYHGWKNITEQRLQRVYTIVKR